MPPKEISTVNVFLSSTLRRLSDTLHCKGTPVFCQANRFLNSGSGPHVLCQGEFLYGTDPILCALRAKRRRLHRIYLSDTELADLSEK